MTLSGFAMADTKEIKPTVLNEKETKSTKEDDVWFCYLAHVDQSPPDMAGDVTITETYNCTWYDL